MFVRAPAAAWRAAAKAVAARTKHFYSFLGPYINSCGGLESGGEGSSFEKADMGSGHLASGGGAGVGRLGWRSSGP